jgi:hypothetical protein
MSELGLDSTGMELVAMHNKLNKMLFAESWRADDRS